MKKDIICYPLVIEKDLNDNTYKAYFPDIERYYSSGETLQDAILNSKEAFGLYYLEAEKDNKEIKEPSDPKDIKLKNNQMLVYIDLNIKWIKEKDKYKSISRMVTLPKWLNEKAKESDINVSAVLQKALLEALNQED